jgi:energy-coupling factor transport system permease protein
MEYLDVSSPIHRLNPLTKFLALLGLFVLGMVFSNIFELLGLILVIYLLYLFAKAAAVFKTYLRLLIVAGIFMMVLQLLFAHDGAELFRYIPQDIPVLGWLGVINKDSLIMGVQMVARMAVFGLSLPLLLTTTESRDLVLVMVEKLRLPYPYAFMFITSLRFIPALFVEIENILQAQRARAFQMTSRNPVKQVKAYLPLVTPLVMIALKKAERLAIAMETRGYGIGKRTYLRKPVFGKADLFTCIGFTLIAIIAVLFRVLGWIS